ncbi:MAG: restriction endonuclease subunit S [Nostoc sp.]|uniref:restriction endonuclease subunit S n=1 Tax=Nostoc sp. TaxID=1180 RepID=UPI002FF2FA1A
MTTANQELPKVFGVWFKDLQSWSVNSFFKVGWQWLKEFIQPLHTALQRKQVEINRKESPLETLQLITLHFDGSIELRNLKGKSEFKGKLFSASPGDVIYSKIDVRNGAIGVIPDDMPLAAVSSEFPVYAVLPDVALPDYIQLVFRSQQFLQLINSMISGTSGRKRVQPEQLEQIEIPLPPIGIQQAIVDRWQTTQEEIKAITERIVNQEKETWLNLQQILGRERKNILIKPKAFALWWSEIQRWGVDMCWRERNQPQESQYPTVKINEICQIGSGGTPSRKNASYFGGDIPWVKTTEVRNEMIFRTEESITKLGLDNSSAKVYPVGSIIIAMYGQGATRGRTGKLGIEAATNQACAVLTNFSEDVDPDFVWIYLISEYDRLRELASGNNQPNLNADMIANYPIPIPSLDIQKYLVKRVEQGKKAIFYERAAAERKRQEIEAEIEALILGTKQIEVAV